MLIALASSRPALAQDDDWTGGAGSPYWDAPKNWSGGLPVAADTVVIGSKFETNLRSGSSFTITGLQDAGPLDVTGGQLAVSGTGTITGTVSWTGGTLGGVAAGHTTFKSSLAISGNNTKLLSLGTFNTQGTTTWGGNTTAGGNTIEVYGPTINNTGTWLDTNAFSSSLVEICCAPTTQFNNLNTYTKTGDSVTTITAAFNNTGTVNVDAGTLSLASLSNFSGSTLTRGTYDIAGTLQFTGANIVTNDAAIELKGSSAKLLNSTNALAALANFRTNATGGSFDVTGGYDFKTLGAFTNNGVLSVGSGSTFTVNGALTNLSGTTLENGTYSVGGTFKAKGANIVTNDATLGLTSASAEFLNSSTNKSALSAFAHNATGATFSLAGGAAFTTAGSFTNAGNITIGTGSSFTTGSSGAFTQSAGKLTDDGLFASTSGITLTGGSLIGVGTIKGNLQSSGTITPGNSATSAGILTETGAYTQSASGNLDISIGGTTAGSKYDEFKATTAKLAGTLNVSLIDGFVPTVGSTFKIVGFNSESGQFSKVNGLAINNSEHFAISYQGTDVLLTAASGATASGAAASKSVTVPAATLRDASLDKFRSSVLFQDRGAQSRGSLIGGTTLTSRSPAIGRPREGGKLSRANFQFSVPGLFARPSFSMGVN